jgi:apolipoprotein D and lipocalin family protein
MPTSRSLAVPLVTASALLLQSCSAVDKPAVKTVDHVDLERFMGDWYVVANIPTLLERGAHNAVESYRQLDDGRIATTFSFNDGSFDGPRRTFTPTGYVFDKDSNAVWGMQFIWPFKADYRVIYLKSDYSQTIIGRNRRDYVWVMARVPQVTENDMQLMLKVIADQGYDVSKVEMVPQRWPEPLSGEQPAP